MTSPTVDTDLHCLSLRSLKPDGQPDMYVLRNLTQQMCPWLILGASPKPISFRGLHKALEKTLCYLWLCTASGHSRDHLIGVLTNEDDFEIKFRSSALPLLQASFIFVHLTLLEVNDRRAWSGGARRQVGPSCIGHSSLEWGFIGGFRIIGLEEDGDTSQAQDMVVYVVSEIFLLHTGSLLSDSL